jgi:hypothetical protein
VRNARPALSLNNRRIPVSSYEQSTKDRIGVRMLLDAEARGLGDAAFRDVCAYAARYGTRHRRLRDAVDVVRDEHAAQCEITCDHVLVSK